MRPPPPDWLIQHVLNRANVDAVHTGECWAATKSGRCRPVTRQQALEALRVQVPARSTAERTPPSASSTRACIESGSRGEMILLRGTWRSDGCAVGPHGP
ncbi:DUF6233 domain-containing protein, partial [Streptomyces sp. NPDC001315]|uniref:DUF6233 domain-containing protein n=1 Tax=Streptomyces sp. NPDC001315 TaxID=3364562 RepID=UPI003677AD6E